jgi:hypothetical protein
VVVAYFPGAFPEAEIAATPAEFAAIAERIVELAHAGGGNAIFPASSSRESSALVVQIGSGCIIVTFAEEVLSVCGGQEAINLFASCLPSEATLSAGYHVHFEHSSRDETVAPESIPLVMLVE